MMRRVGKYRVIVEPLRPTATKDEVMDLFKPLEIRDVVLSHQGGRYMATVTLNSDRDMEIACLRDNTMHVQPVKCDSYTEVLVSKQPEGPKNLYVLNIPLYVSIEELRNLFEKYGRVQHCVILSMLDGHARKRGFVDMESAKEAQNAVQAIHGYIWHGYTMEVSYARIQRGSAADTSKYNAAPSSHLIIRGLLPYATIDKQDILDMISPYTSKLHVTIPELSSNLRDTYSVRVALHGIQQAERVMDALNDQIIIGQHLQVQFDDQS